MKCFILIATVVAVATAQGGAPNFSTMQGIQQFLASENISPSSIVLKNCILNGNSCSTSGGQPCCLSPVFSCQSNPQAGGASQCLVVPPHRVHIPQIQQLLQTFGITTQKPIQ